MRCPVVVVFVPEKILESWRWRSVYVALFAPLSLPSFRCPIWNGASSFQLGRHAACPPFGLAVQAMTCLACLACPTQPLVFDRATGDTGQQAARVQRQPGGQIPLPLLTLPFAVPYFYFFILLFLTYFILGFQSGAVLCPAAFQHYDGVVDSSSFRGGLSLPSASGRGGLRFGVLTLEGVLGVVGISSKQPEHCESGV